MSDLANTLAEKLVRASIAVGAHVPKNGTNSAQNYKFVAEADVIAKCRQALLDEGIVVLPSFRVISETPFETSGGKRSLLTTVEGAFRFISGAESLEVVTLGQGADSGDKGVYKAETGARKYAYLHALALTAGDDDPETEPAPVPVASLDHERADLITALRATFEMAGLAEPEVVANAHQGATLENWPLPYLVRVLRAAIVKAATMAELKQLDPEQFS
jgi:hypothetical protein